MNEDITTVLCEKSIIMDKKEIAQIERLKATQ